MSLVELRDLVQGERRITQFTATDPVTGDPFDLSSAVVKWVGKTNPALPNFRAEFFKTSYPSGLTVITDAANGVYTVELAPVDSQTLEPARIEWDTQITDVGASVTAAGTLAVTAGTDVDGLITLTGTGTDFSSVEVGDQLLPAGVPVANQVRCTIEAVDAALDTLKTDYLGWATESGIGFEIFKGLVRIPEDGRGCINVVQGITR